MSGEEFRHYSREEFLDEFYPDTDDRAAIAAGVEQPRAEQRAYCLAEMRRRLGFSHAQVADRMGVTQGRVSAIRTAACPVQPCSHGCRAFATCLLVALLGCRDTPFSRLQPVTISTVRVTRRDREATPGA
jgi:hypothetical protein